MSTISAPRHLIIAKRKTTDIHDIYVRVHILRVLAPTWVSMRLSLAHVEKEIGV